MAFVKRKAGATALGVAMLTGYGLSVIPAQAGLIGAEVTYEYSLSDTSTIDIRYRHKR